MEMVQPDMSVQRTVRQGSAKESKSLVQVLVVQRRTLPLLLFLQVQAGTHAEQRELPQQLVLRGASNGCGAITAGLHKPESQQVCLLS
jgi:hypothetical protein